jgi:hypothetical protein
MFKPGCMGEAAMEVFRACVVGCAPEVPWVLCVLEPLPRFDDWPFETKKSIFGVSRSRLC